MEADIQLTNTEKNKKYEAMKKNLKKTKAE